MSRTYLRLKNKQQKHSKMHFKQYLYSVSVPPQRIHDYSPAELEAELIENSYNMGHQVRHITQRLRNRYS